MILVPAVPVPSTYDKRRRARAARFAPRPRRATQAVITVGSYTLVFFAPPGTFPLPGRRRHSRQVQRMLLYRARSRAAHASYDVTTAIAMRGMVEELGRLSARFCAVKGRW